MNFSKIQQAINDIRQIDKESVYVVADELNERVIDDDIEVIEAKIGIKLCEDYKYFIKKWAQIETNDVSIIGLYRENGKIVDVISDTTFEIFSEYYFEGVNTDNRTIVGVIPESDEWFYVLDHFSSEVIPFDAFAKSYVQDQAQPFEQFVLDNLFNILNRAKNPVFPRS